MAITLTEKAAARVSNYLENQSQAQGLRLGIRNTGCSGYMYTVGIAELVEPEDQLFESHGIKILVNTSNLIYLEGMEIDYVNQGLKEGFQFNNPNVKEKCGCGESFNITSVGVG